LNPNAETLEYLVAKQMCERDHLFFTRYFFRARQGIKFKINWHHKLISDTLEKIIKGELKNVVITVPPGSSKTELAVINFIARGLALNPRARFLHLSGSDSLASLNSSSAREIIRSDEYQRLWPLRIADDANAKKRWNVLVDGQPAGGVYATSLGGQITGFRAGHMAEGFQGAIIIDDPIKPEDAFSRTKLDAANRKLLTTVKSRKANPETPIILIMQRIAESDPAGFIEDGNLEGHWTFIKIPAVVTKEYAVKLPDRYRSTIDDAEVDLKGRFSYWPYKEPLAQLLAMERGDGADQTGARISRHVFSSQYQQEPVTLGGNMIKGEYFERYTVLPKIKYRKIYADTAQKTKERNDFSVFEEWGFSEEGKIYLLDLIRGKWEAPELQRRAIAFWNKSKAREVLKYGQLREMAVEDKSSGTGLIQSLKVPPYNIPVKAIERDKDKLTRVMDVLPYIELKLASVPEGASFTNDFISECESFTPDDSHDFDDQVDPFVDAVNDMLANNKIKVWGELAKNSEPKEIEAVKVVQKSPQSLLESILSRRT
jgi:predicted phage terminase large subunit-like protein